MPLLSLASCALSHSELQRRLLLQLHELQETLEQVAVAEQRRRELESVRTQVRDTAIRLDREFRDDWALVVKVGTAAHGMTKKSVLAATV